MFARGGARRVVGAVALSLATCLVALVCLHSSHSGVELLGRPQALVGDAMLDDPSLVFGSTKAATQQLAGVSQASARYAARWENQAQSELNAYSDISSNILAVPKKERAAPETEQRTERKMSLKEELADARAHNQELNTYKDILGPMKGESHPHVTVAVRHHDGVLSFPSHSSPAKGPAVRDHHGILTFPAEEPVSKTDRAKATEAAAEVATEYEAPLLAKQLGTYNILEFPPTVSHVTEAAQQASAVKRSIKARLEVYNAFDFPPTAQQPNAHLARSAQNQDKEVAAQLAGYQLLSFPPVEQHPAVASKGHTVRAAEGQAVQEEEREKAERGDAAAEQEVRAEKDTARAVEARLRHYNSFDFPPTAQQPNARLARAAENQEKEIAAQLSGYDLLSFPSVEQHAATAVEKHAATPVAAGTAETLVAAEEGQAVQEEEHTIEEHRDTVQETVKPRTARGVEKGGEMGVLAHAFAAANIKEKEAGDGPGAARAAREAEAAAAPAASEGQAAVRAEREREAAANGAAPVEGGQQAHAGDTAAADKEHESEAAARAQREGEAGAAAAGEKEEGAKEARPVELAQVGGVDLGGPARLQALSQESSPELAGYNVLSFSPEEHHAVAGSDSSSRSPSCEECLAAWSVQALSCAEEHCTGGGKLSYLDKQQLIINFQVGAELAHYVGPQNTHDAETSVLLDGFVKPWAPDTTAVSSEVPSWWSAEESQEFKDWTHLSTTTQTQSLRYAGKKVLIGKHLTAASDSSLYSAQRKTFGDAMAPIMKRQRALNFLRKKDVMGFGHGLTEAKAIIEANEGQVAPAVIAWRAPSKHPAAVSMFSKMMRRPGADMAFKARAKELRTKRIQAEIRATQTQLQTEAGAVERAEYSRTRAKEQKTQRIQAEIQAQVRAQKKVDEAAVTKAQIRTTKAQLRANEAQVERAEDTRARAPLPPRASRALPPRRARASAVAPHADGVLEGLKEQAGKLQRKLEERTEKQVAAEQRQVDAAKTALTQDPVLAGLEAHAAVLQRKLAERQENQLAAAEVRQAQKKALDYTLQDKEKELSELQWQSRPLKENLAKGMTRADAQLQNDLRDDEARLATVTHAVAQHSAARTLAKVTRTERALEARHATLEATVDELKQHEDPRAPAARQDAAGDLNAQVSKHAELERTIRNLQRKLRARKLALEADGVKMHAVGNSDSQKLTQVPKAAARELSGMAKATEAEQLAQAEELIATAQSLALDLGKKKLEARGVRATRDIQRKLSEVSTVLQSRAAMLLNHGTVTDEAAGRNTALQLLASAEEEANVVHAQAHWGGASDAAKLNSVLEQLAPVLSDGGASPRASGASQEAAREAAKKREEEAKSKQTLEKRLRGAISALKARQRASLSPGKSGVPAVSPGKSGVALDKMQAAMVRDEQALYKSGDFLPPLQPKYPASVLAKGGAAQSDDVLVAAGEEGTTTGVDSQSQLLRNDVSALVEATKVSDPKEYDAMLQAAIRKKEAALASYSKAQTFAAKSVDSSLSSADGVFTDGGDFTSGEAMGGSAVQRAIASAKRIERDMHIVFAKPVPHNAAKAKLTEERRALEAKRASEIRKAEYVPGIGRVHSEGSIVKELWDHHRVSAAKAEAIAGRVAPIASARGLHTARLDDNGVLIKANQAAVNTRQPSGWKVAEDDIQGGESFGSELGNLISDDKAVKVGKPAATQPAGLGNSLWSMV